MTKHAKGLFAGAICLLVVSTFFQVLALYAISPGSPLRELGYAPAIDTAAQGWLVPVWVLSVAVLPLAALLCLICRKKEGWSLAALALAIAGAVLALAVMLALPTETQFNPLSSGDVQGLTTWRLIYRHGSPVLAGGLIALTAYLNHRAARQERLTQQESAYEEHYLPLMEDAESTLGLDGYARHEGNTPPAHKEKKSRRAAARKQQNP